MSNEYYGVASTPMDDFLAHYGVRGMKWGVTKAIHKGTDKAMTKVYKKAQKKLEKLQKEADTNYQKNEIAYHKRKAISSAAVAPIGVAGTHFGNKAAYYEARKASELGKKMPATFGQIGSAVATGASMLATLGAAGKSGYHTGKAIRAKHLTTAKGHAKAVAKRDNWAKEMNSTFKSVGYDASSGSLKNKRKKTANGRKK